MAGRRGVINPSSPRSRVAMWPTSFSSFISVQEGYYMLTYRTSVVCTMALLCLILLTSCTGSSAPVTTTPTTTITSTPTTPNASPSPTVIPTASGTSATTPTHYTRSVILSGVGRPDDLVFDQQ